MKASNENRPRAIKIRNAAVTSENQSCEPQVALQYHALNIQVVSQTLKYEDRGLRSRLAIAVKRRSAITMYRNWRSSPHTVACLTPALLHRSHRSHSRSAQRCDAASARAVNFLLANVLPSAQCLKLAMTPLIR